jgi:cobyrinic acid a,c-diamide synthase
VRQIRDLIPASILRRYRQLHKKQQNGSITAKECEEMLLLTDYIEEKSAERVMLLGALAAIRQINISELAKQLRLQTLHA